MRKIFVTPLVRLKRSLDVGNSRVASPCKEPHPKQVFARLLRLSI
jgi:hypothetical protein